MIRREADRFAARREADRFAARREADRFAARRAAALLVTASLSLAAVLAGGPAGATATTASGGGKARTPAPLSSAVVGTAPAGFTLAAEGPLTAQQFASYAPDPTAAATSLARLSGEPSFRTYQRTWTGSRGNEAITDLVVALPSPTATAPYRSGQEAALAGTPGARTAKVPGVPGAKRYTYPIGGVEQVVVFTTGRAVATVSFTSAAGTANPRPFTADDTDAFALRQYGLLYRSPYGGSAFVSSSNGVVTAGWVMLGLAVLALVALVLLLCRRRRRPATDLATDPVDQGEEPTVPCLPWEPR